MVKTCSWDWYYQFKWSVLPLRGIGNTTSRDRYYPFKGSVLPIPKIGNTHSKDRYATSKLVWPIQRIGITISRDRYYRKLSRVSDLVPVTVLEMRCYLSGQSVIPSIFCHARFTINKCISCSTKNTVLRIIWCSHRITDRGPHNESGLVVARIDGRVGIGWKPGGVLAARALEERKDVPRRNHGWSSKKGMSNGLLTRWRQVNDKTQYDGGTC